MAVFTGKDMTGVNSLPCGWDLGKDKNIPGVVQDLVMPPHMPLASDEARHVGDPVAIVIADSQAAALDGAELVVVDWEPLPAVTEHREGAPGGAAACPRVGARQRGVQVGDRGPRAPPMPPSVGRRSSSRSASSTSVWSPMPWSRGPAWRASTRLPRS